MGGQGSDKLGRGVGMRGDFFGQLRQLQHVSTGCMEQHVMTPLCMVTPVEHTYSGPRESRFQPRAAHCRERENCPY